jgi:hypothetical protein
MDEKEAAAAGPSGAPDWAAQARSASAWLRSEAEGVGVWAIGEDDLGADAMLALLGDDAQILAKALADGARADGWADWSRRPPGMTRSVSIGATGAPGLVPAKPLLCWAAINGKPECLEELLAAGADPDQRCGNGDSALHCAAGTVRGSGGWGDERKLRCVQLLCRTADLEAKNSVGLTPLLCAVNAGSIEAVELLLKAGAKNTPTPAGSTPRELAQNLAVASGGSTSGPWREALARLLERWEIERAAIEGQSPQSLTQRASVLKEKKAPKRRL